jgi:sugar lactone lactonase YvrE
MRSKYFTVYLVLALLLAPFTLANSRGDYDTHGIVKILVRGSPTDGANGLGFDPNNRMYVGCVGGGRRGINVMDPESGRILDRIGQERGVEGADDLTFGPDGAVYYTALFTGEVGRLAPDGTHSTVANLPLGVNPITFSDDGRLFVALDFMGDALYELYLDGVTPPRLIASNLGWLNGMDWGADGYLYGPLILRNEVVKVDVSTGAITPIADGFTYPTAVKFGPDGELYMVDSYRVIRLDIHTGEKEVIAEVDRGLDNLAFDNYGRLFVTNNDLGSVYEIRRDRKPRLVSPGGMSVPMGVAVLPAQDHHERVYVANVFPIFEYDGKTGKLLSLDQDIPSGLSMTIVPDGNNLVLSSWFANMVTVYDPQARQILEAYPDFAVPLDAIRFQGDLVVAELGTGQVVRRDAETGARSSLAQLYIPAGLASTDDDLWASDWASGMVWQIVLDGVPVLISVASGLNKPEGLAIGPDGSLLVVETGAGRLARIDPGTGQVSTIAEGLALGAVGPSTMPPTWNYNGVAVGPSGAIYVTGEIANVLYRINWKWK